jgi:putative Mg2+ transporter-C (MgtC) family protein
MVEFWTGYELDFAIDILVSLAAGFFIGAEREARGKAVGISTNCFVIGGSMIFTYLSAAVDPNSNQNRCATCHRNWILGCRDHIERRTR